MRVFGNSLNKASRSLGVPLTAIFERLAKRDVVMTLEEDNETAIACMKAGFSHAMRDLARMSGVSLAALHEL